MFNGQLEMSFDQTVQFGARRQRRLSRAQWWFQRMRQIVERATDWHPCPPPRPEQIWFPAPAGRPVVMLAHPGLAKRRPSEEREICA